MKDAKTGAQEGEGRQAMDYRVLGPLEVLDGDGPLPLGGAKQ